MSAPWISGLGAALSDLGGNTLDEKRRLRALQQAQAQFEAEQGMQREQLGVQREQLGETRRHNSALEALKNSELQNQAASTEALRRRQNIDSFQQGAAGGGLNWLNPEAAYDRMNAQPEASLDMPAVGQALNAFSQASQRQFMGNIESTASTLSNQNRSQGFVPGSELYGGAILENKSFSPYSGSQWSAGLRAADQEAMEFRNAQDDIRLAGDSAHLQGTREATEIQKLTDLTLINAAAQAARDKAQRDRAVTWSTRLRSIYPRNAHLYTVEALLGQMVASPSQPTLPVQQGSNPLIPGGGSVQQQGAPSPRPPSGNPLIR